MNFVKLFTVYFILYVGVFYNGVDIYIMHALYIYTYTLHILYDVYIRYVHGCCRHNCFVKGVKIECSVDRVKIDTQKSASLLFVATTVESINL